MKQSGKCFIVGVRAVLVPVLLFALIASAAPAHGEEGENRPESLVRVSGAVPGSALLKQLAAFGADILSTGPNGAVVAARAGDLQWLESRGKTFTVVRDDLSAFFGDVSALVDDSEFHTYSQVRDELQAMAAAHPDIALFHDIGDSIEGRDIWALEISDNVGEDESGEARVLLVGCHHAREWISVEVPLLIADFLVNEYGSDDRARAAVDRAEIWIVPMLNPDGHVFSVAHNRLWRKNRRDNGNGTWGVDLNRNYGYEWGYDNVGSSPNPGSETYRGTGPFSEPETVAVRDLLAAGRPFSAVIGYHNFSQLVLYPWGFTTEPTPDHSYYGFLAETMAAMITAVYDVPYTAGGGPDALYPTNGSNDDYVYGTYRAPAFTIELRPGPEHGYDGFVNPPEDIAPTFEENLPAALWLIEMAAAGLPLPPDVDVTGRVDGMDLGHISYSFGAGEDDDRWDEAADVDGNGVVDGDDLAELAFYFGITAWGWAPW